MEEYKNIIKSASVPSFYTVLFLCAVILISYSFHFKSSAGLIAGTLLALISIFLMIKIRSGTDRAEACSENPGKHLFITITKKTAIPLLISAIVIIRITSLLNSANITNMDKSFPAYVDSVRLLQYSKEVILIFNQNQSRAISYISKNFDINTGDTIEIFRPPEDIKKIKGQPLFMESLTAKGFSHIFYINSANDYKIINSAPESIKAGLRRIIEKNIRGLFNAETASVLMALYFGNKNYIDKAVIQDFKRAGALHILAASGLHVGIIGSLVFFSLLIFRINKKILLLITLSAIYFYLYITDMPVSLLRAFTMFLIFSLQYFFNLERNIFNTLFLSAIAILVIYPYDIYDLGFQLSFGATLGIILFYRFYSRAFSSLPKFFSNSLAVTVSAQVFVLPIILVHLHEINIIGVASNLVLIPGMALTLVLSVISNIVSVFSQEAGRLTAFAADKVYQASLFLVRWFSGLNGHFAVNQNPLPLLLPYACSLAPLLPLKKIEKSGAVFVIAGFFGAWLFLSGFSMPPNKQLAIIKEGESQILIYRDGDAAAVTGTLLCTSSIEKITEYITNNSIRTVELHIPYTDRRNLMNFNALLKKTVVTKCYISSDALSNFYFKKICEVIDSDSIGLELRDFKKEKRILNNKAENLLSVPREDIYYIYKKLEKNNFTPEKTAVGQPAILQL